MSFTESIDAIVVENRNQLLSKHHSWERVRLGDVVDILNGFPFESAQFSGGGGGTPLIRIRDIVRGASETSYLGGYQPEFLVAPGDLLIGMDGDFNCAFWRGEPGLLNQRCGKLSVVSECLDLRFLAYCLPGYLAAINAHTSSITVKHLSSRTVADIPLPLPPEREQSRIADALDELLSDLDAGVKALESVRTKLKQYRAAVLKAAVEGTLTAEWRKAHPDVEPASELLNRILTERRRRWEEAQLKKYKDAGKKPPKNWKVKYQAPTKPALAKWSSLPECWTWTGFQELSDGVPHALKAGPFGSSLKKEFYSPAGYKIYGQEQVINDDAFFGNYFIDAKRFKQLESCAVKPDDILISLVGTTGRVLVLPKGALPGIINPRLLKVTLVPNRVRPAFIKLVLESPQARAFFKTNAHGGTMDVLNLGILKAFCIPLPPLLEQEAITEAIDDHFSVINHLESDLEAKLKSAQALRQSILKAAFEGKLVPQDPNDEPATELLKRIAAERAERERLAKQAKKPAKPAKVRGPKRRQNVNAASTA